MAVAGIFTCVVLLVSWNCSGLGLTVTCNWQVAWPPAFTILGEQDSADAPSLAGDVVVTKVLPDIVSLAGCIAEIKLTAWPWGFAIVLIGVFISVWISAGESARL